MKKIQFISILSAFLLLLSSCEDFLHLPPPEVISEEEAFKTKADVWKLMNSVYTNLGSGSFYGGQVQVCNELLADHIDGTSLDGDYLVIFNRSSSIFEGVIGGLYSEGYKAIYRCNKSIEILDRFEYDDSSKNIKGQALFCRALAHFELLRLFAQPYGYTGDNSHLGIPYTESSIAAGAVRLPVSEVYFKIIKDLEDAETLLPASNNGYPDRWSVQALLAKVYFQMNEFGDAYNYANDVINQGNATFNIDSTEFYDRYSPQGSMESVFTISSPTLIINTDEDDSDYGQEITNWVNRGSTFSGLYRSDGTMVPSINIASSLFSQGTSEVIDKRNVWYDDISQAPLIVTTKFNFDNNQNPLDSVYAFSVAYMTITELKFIRAESAGELGTNLGVASLDLQEILDRAYGVGNKTAPSDAVQIISTARNQRKLEFVFEGDQVQQLKRRGAKGEDIYVRGAPWDCPGMILQFPQSEIANSPGFEKNPEGGCN